MIAEIGASKWKRTLRTEQDFLRLFGFTAIANAPKNERRERDLNPRDPYGSQAGRLTHNSRLAPYRARRPRQHTAFVTMSVFMLLVCEQQPLSSYQQSWRIPQKIASRRKCLNSSSSGNIHGKRAPGVWKQLEHAGTLHVR